jgi:aryl-alcohol dehydrogenase-like predicted oxidoreductase
MSMSGIYGNANDDESIRVIHHALDKGINHLDSSDMYGWGHNETLLGKALKGRREGVIVGTKFGQTKDAGRQAGRERQARVRDAGLRGEPEAPGHRRHRPLLPAPRRHHRADRGHGRRDEAPRSSRARCARSRSRGRAGDDPPREQGAPDRAVQNEYSLMYRKEGEETLACCRELGITLVAYAPLGRSMLTGSVKGKADLPEGDRRLAHPRFQAENLDANVKIVKGIEEIAAHKKCTPSQLVLAWLLAQGKEIIPIPGTKRKQRVDENLAALDVKLSRGELEKISAIAPVGAGAGLRYPAEGLKRVYL